MKRFHDSQKRPNMSKTVTFTSICNLGKGSSRKIGKSNHFVTLQKFRSSVPNLTFSENFSRITVSHIFGQGHILQSGKKDFSVISSY
jgi:hypothetical protein